MKFKIDPEIAGLFEPLDKRTYEGLKKLIQRDGIRDPLIVAKDGTLVCGHQRDKIAQDLGIDPPYKVRPFKDRREMMKYAIEDNLLRRHLNNYQKALAALRLLRFEREEARERKLSTLKKGDKAPERFILNDRGRAYQKAAERVGLGESTLRKVEYIEKYCTPFERELGRTKKKSINELFQEAQKTRAETELGTLIRLAGSVGKTLTSKRGDLVQLEGDTAYFKNQTNSFIFKIDFTKEVGTGTFYAGEVPSFVESIKRVGNLVSMDWVNALGVPVGIMVPDKRPIKKKAKRALTEHFRKPNIVLSPSHLRSALQPNELCTILKLEKDVLLVTQRRADGTVTFWGRVPAKHDGAVVGEEVTVFTVDIQPLLKFMADPIKMHIKRDTPISIQGRLLSGATLKGIVSYMKYER